MTQVIITQTKKGSLYEAVINTFIGFFITLALAPIVYPIFGHSFSMQQNLGIAAFFTIVSILRGYVVRRWFNGKIKRMAQTLASLK